MNIKQAKEQITQAVNAYRMKDEFGNYIIPIERQRPVFLMGPPGIGKTAIMEQIAQELEIGLVTYSMTHHTRQSALGLPFIVHKNYRGQEYDVSEYTMSEIIASVYERIEEDHVEEGILFLDEINCVSETLAPSMLQFLQYKTFGRHRVPDGWIVVTAGNPQEFNNSVREFDIVTWDRLKRIDVEPDYKVWREYALAQGVHPSILTYLELRYKEFYSIETTIDGKSFVTARGWVDLSDMIKLYEKLGYSVNYSLITQYLQNKTIARTFAAYYDLYGKYKQKYTIPNIIEGIQPSEIVNQAKAAAFDERLTIIMLLLDAIDNNVREVMSMDDGMKLLLQKIKAVKADIISSNSNDTACLLNRLVNDINKSVELGVRSNAMKKETAMAMQRAANILSKMSSALLTENLSNGNDVFNIIKSEFNKEASVLKDEAQKIRVKLDNVFIFCEKAFGDGHELLILVTELTLRSEAARFIGKYGCERYYKHNKNLLFYERQKDIVRQIDDLEIDK